jgi:hypothetical protein
MSNDEYDSPWKEAIKTYFQECIELFFPVAAEGISARRYHQPVSVYRLGDEIT